MDTACKRLVFSPDLAVSVCHSDKAPVFVSPALHFEHDSRPAAHGEPAAALPAGRLPTTERGVSGAKTPSTMAGLRSLRKPAAVPLQALAPAAAAATVEALPVIVPVPLPAAAAAAAAAPVPAIVSDPPQHAMTRDHEANVDVEMMTDEFDLPETCHDFQVASETRIVVLRRILAVAKDGTRVSQRSRSPLVNERVPALS